MKDKVAFYQVSDKVPSEVITEFTKKCERDDCRVSARIGMTTLTGTADYYNKDGILVVQNYNSYSLDVCCRKCWKAEELRIESGKVVCE